MSTESPTQTLITRAQLAARWHVHVDTIARREREGVVRPIKVGHKTLYSLEEIQRVEATP